MVVKKYWVGEANHVPGLGGSLLDSNPTTVLEILFLMIMITTAVGAA
jgi:hypothetical protein